MLTTKWLPSWKAGRLCAKSELLHSTRGGSSDTELNEFAVMPCSLPPRSRVVMIVTPVAKEPSALRSSRELKPSAAVLCTVALWLPGRSFGTLRSSTFGLALRVRARGLEGGIGRQAQRDATVHGAVDVPIQYIMRVRGMRVAERAL